MRKYFKITTAFIAAILISVCFSNSILAAEVGISADKDSYEVGDEVKIDIKIEGAEDLASAPEFNIEYNPARLSFVDSSVEYGGGGGGLLTINDTEATITFTTLSGGDASVRVSGTVNEEDVSNEAVLSVAGEDTAVGTDEVASTDTGVEAGSIVATDGRIVQKVFSNDYLPKLFEKGVVTYQGQDVECARFTMADMVLLFTTDEAETDARFMIYNQGTGSLSEYRMIEGIENEFIIILNEWEGEIPEGYVKSELDWNGQLLVAFKNENANAGLSSLFGGLSANDFFLVYGLSSNGTKGWYQYDLSEGTYQRFVQYVSNDSLGDMLAEEDENSGSDETFLDEFLSGTAQMIIIFVLLALTLIFFIVMIVLIVKVSHFDDYEYMDPEEYMQMQNISNKKATNMVRKSLADDEEDDEDDEDDDDKDDNQEDDGIEEENRKPKQKKASKRDIEEDDEDDEEIGDEDDEDLEDYFDPRMSKKEAKAYEKQLRREEKLAQKEEKWRQKEEKRAAKMRQKGYEESSPMDWSAFSEERDDEEDTRRPVGRGSMPAYMMEDDEEEVETPKPSRKKSYAEDDEERIPARKNAPMSAQREAESAMEKREDELRMKQKRLFEQQQLIEEQRRIEREQYEQEQLREQEKYIQSQQQDEDLDEDFHFEFLDV